MEIEGDSSHYEIKDNRQKKLCTGEEERETPSVKYTLLVRCCSLALLVVHSNVALQYRRKHYSFVGLVLFRVGRWMPSCESRVTLELDATGSDPARCVGTEEAGREIAAVAGEEGVKVMRSAGASAAASVAVPGAASGGVGFVSTTVRLARQIGHNRLDLRSQSMISFSWNR